MTVKEAVDALACEILTDGGAERTIESVFCCDLLSFVMGRAPANSAWVTVMGNQNSVAVAVLADVACIVLAHGATPDALMLAKAKSEGVSLLRTNLPIFEAAKKIDSLIAR